MSFLRQLSRLKGIVAQVFTIFIKILKIIVVNKLYIDWLALFIRFVNG